MKDNEEKVGNVSNTHTGVFVGFVDSEENIVYQLPYPLILIYKIEILA